MTRHYQQEPNVLNSKKEFSEKRTNLETEISNPKSDEHQKLRPKLRLFLHEQRTKEAITHMPSASQSIDQEKAMTCRSSYKQRKRTSPEIKNNTLQSTKQK